VDGTGFDGSPAFYAVSSVSRKTPFQAGMMPVNGGLRMQEKQALG
jgi:hypothetical protein